MTGGNEKNGYFFNLNQPEPFIPNHGWVDFLILFLNKLKFVLQGMKNFLFLFAILMLASCANKKTDTVTPARLLLELTDSERYVSVDKLADWIIQKDPSLRLVDVRSHEAYDAFTLPGALNIPISEMLTPDNQEFMDCRRYNIVFFSNDDLMAEQAWLIGRRKACKSRYILKGGLNEWTATILDSEEPGELASAEELELHEFRKAARQYFIGGSDELEPEKFQEIVKPQPVVEKKKIEVAPKPQKPAVEEEEGC